MGHRTSEVVWHPLPDGISTASGTGEAKVGSTLEDVGQIAGLTQGWIALDLGEAFDRARHQVRRTRLLRVQANAKRTGGKRRTWPMRIKPRASDSRRFPVS
jgi:hypothetical protein